MELGIIDFYKPQIIAILLSARFVLVKPGFAKVNLGFLKLTLPVPKIYIRKVSPTISAADILYKQLQYMILVQSCCMELDVILNRYTA